MYSAAMGPQSFVRKSLRILRSIVGQRQFYRAARLLMFEAQFDVLNQPDSNGERYVQSVVGRHFKSPVVFDVGANIGDWTASLLGQGNATAATVHAFEPCRGTFELLQRRFPRRGGLFLNQAACSDHVGLAILAVDAVASGSNALANDDFATKEEVALTTIDAYCRDNSIAHINLLKVDAEGHDSIVLLGALAMLQAHEIDFIQFEYNHRWINERKLLRDAFKYLQPLGYRVGKLTGDAVQFYPNWHAELETYRESNYVACLPEHVHLLRTIPPEWIPTIY
jgi:FkbM family methyltransferase